MSNIHIRLLPVGSPFSSLANQRFGVEVVAPEIALIDSVILAIVVRNLSHTPRAAAIHPILRDATPQCDEPCSNRGELLIA